MANVRRKYALTKWYALNSHLPVYSLVHVFTTLHFSIVLGLIMASLHSLLQYFTLFFPIVTLFLSYIYIWLSSSSSSSHPPTYPFLFLASSSSFKLATPTLLLRIPSFFIWLSQPSFSSVPTFGLVLLFIPSYSLYHPPPRSFILLIRSPVRLLKIRKNGTGKALNILLIIKL